MAVGYGIWRRHELKKIAHLFYRKRMSRSSETIARLSFQWQREIYS
jgi:hypothetical protein